MSNVLGEEWSFPHSPFGFLPSALVTHEIAAACPDRAFDSEEVQVYRLLQLYNLPKRPWEHFKDESTKAESETNVAQMTL